MKRTIRVAAVQMDANPAPVPQRLARAERLATDAAAQGAQLVVLPELFNVGYGYRDANHRHAEPLDGPTAAWMKDVAARLDLHLAGSLIVLEGSEAYNALLLVAPDGRMWRYDKNYPWGWERGYFCGRKNVAVAHTALGDLGLLICWDVAHPDLWRQYAGQVDLIVVSSCPPNVGSPAFDFLGGDRATFDDLGPLVAPLKGIGHRVFVDLPRQQTAWLGVPMVGTVGCGQIRTPIPNGMATLLGFIAGAPWLVRYLPQAKHMHLSCGIVQGCQIVSAAGQVLAQASQAQGETFVITEVALAGTKPVPGQPQPASSLPWTLYFISDRWLPWLTIPVYRRGLRRAWGRHMAPLRRDTARWLALIALGGAAGLLLGSILWRKRRA
jgi:hypothetical protein